MKHVIIVLSVIAILLMGVSTHAFMVATKEVSLPKSESSRLENIVCISRHKISSATVTAYQYSEDQIPLAFNFAYVQCKPHGEFKGLPTYFTARCDYINQKWNCDESEAHTLVIINNRKVDVVPGITKPELADDILKKIITYGSFRGRSIDKGIGDQCHFHKTPDPEELDISCADNIRISFWCPQPEITHCPRILSMGLILD